jgi:hypothetical protein
MIAARLRLKQPHISLGRRTEPEIRADIDILRIDPFRYDILNKIRCFNAGESRIESQHDAHINAKRFNEPYPMRQRIDVLLSLRVWVKRERDARSPDTVRLLYRAF